MGDEGNEASEDEEEEQGFNHIFLTGAPTQSDSNHKAKNFNFG